MKEFQISMKPIVRKFNFNSNYNIQSFSTRKIKKISLPNNSNGKPHQMILIHDFKNKYIQPEDFEKKTK